MNQQVFLRRGGGASKEGEGFGEGEMKDERKCKKLPRIFDVMDACVYLLSLSCLCAIVRDQMAGVAKDGRLPKNKKMTFLFSLLNFIFMM